MSTEAAALEAATIRQQCRVLRMPAIAAQCAQLAEQAVRERRTHLGYLEALLQAELEERDQRLIERRLREARLPRMKSLAEFDFARNSKVSAQQIHELARGDYIAKAEPVIFIGDSGTGKTHLLTGLAVAACRQKRRVRFATAAGLINEMVEAKHQLQLGRALARWARYDLIALDEVGYVPLAEVGAELLFQVIAERAEKAAVIVTTNLVYCRRNLQEERNWTRQLEPILAKSGRTVAGCGAPTWPGAKPGRSREPPRTGELGLKCKAGS
jgi:DNA replication protein DnaC